MPLNQYALASQQLRASRCPICCGVGEIDDLEPGDIKGNTTKCHHCKGTGMAVTKESVVVGHRALNQLMAALLGPPHHIRELQACLNPALFGANPINVIRRDIELQTGE